MTPQFWTGKLGRELRGDSEAQVLGLYLLSGPQANSTGLYRLPIAYATTDTGLDCVEEKLELLEDLGFIRYDWEAEVVWVVEHARHEYGEISEGDKRRKEIERMLLEHEESPLFRSFVEKYRETLPPALSTLGHVVRSAFPQEENARG